MASRVQSSLLDGENQFRLPREPKQKNSWKRKLLRMSRQKRELARHGLKRSVLKRESKGRKAELAKYRKLAKEFLARPENQFCWICQVRRESGENILINFATEVHHWALRYGKLLCYVPYFRASCFRCRDFPHENKTRARELGVLAPLHLCGVFPSSGNRG